MISSPTTLSYLAFFLFSIFDDRTILNLYEILLQLFVASTNRTAQAKAISEVRNRCRPIAKQSFDTNLISQYVQKLVVLSIIIRDVGDGVEVVLLAALDCRKWTASLVSPSNDVQSISLDRLRVLRWHNSLIRRTADADQHGNGRANDVDTGSFGDGEVLHSRCKVFWGIEFLKIDGLLAKVMVILQPVDNVIVEERLGPDTRYIDLLLAECVDKILGVLLLGVAIERHGHLRWRGLELRCEVSVARVRFHEVNVLIEGQELATSVVELCAPVWGSGLVGLGCACRGIEAILFATKRAVYMGDKMQY